MYTTSSTCHSSTMTSHVLIWLVLAIRFVTACVEHHHFTRLYHIQNISSQYLSLVHLTKQVTLMDCAQSVLKHPQRMWFFYNNKTKDCVTSDCWALPVQAQEDTGNIYYFKQVRAEGEITSYCDCDTHWDKIWKTKQMDKRPLCGSYKSPKCPENFVRRGPSCYWYSTTIGTYDSARSKCKLLGGDLAKVTTKEEHDFIRSTATSTYYFVGATDLRLEGKWAWEGEATEIAYSDWAPGQPMNDSEHCMDLMKDYDYKMNDAPCDAKINFICEQSAKC